MAFSDFFLGKDARTERSPIFTGQQQGLQSDIIQQALQQLQGMPGQANKLQNLLGSSLPGIDKTRRFDFNPIAQQASNRFYGQTLPGLAERFTAMGGSGRSGGFQNFMQQRSGDFENQLASLRSQYGIQQEQLANQRQDQLARQQLQQRALQGNLFGQRQQGLSSLLGAGLQPQFNTLSYPRQPGFLENTGNTLVNLLPQLLPFLL